MFYQHNLQGKLKYEQQCIRPEPMKIIADPACGTGGFFLAAYDIIAKHDLDKVQKRFLKYKTLIALTPHG
ncbi:MAG: SAM-dependent DNA methyltransferase [Nitrospirae bacterium]|nr:SAM-dependent DNA methyltransferase [Nitrospirota bacterium]